MMKRIEEYMITVTIEEDTFKLFLERELLVPGGKLFNIYSNNEFFDCILCWEEMLSNKIKECHFVGNYKPDKGILEELTSLIKEWQRRHNI